MYRFLDLSKRNTIESTGGEATKTVVKDAISKIFGKQLLNRLFVKTFVLSVRI